MDYPGKVITKTQVTPTQTSASGNWTLDDQAAAIKNNNWPVALVPNPISKSLRFNSADSAYLNRTLTTPTNNKIWTWNAWIKRSALGSAQTLFSAQVDVNNWGYVGFLSGDTLTFQQADAGSVDSTVTTTQVFRDVSAWYCLTVVFDSTQATSSNRLKMYLNGVQITAFSTATYLAQNTASRINTAISHQLSRYISAANYLNGYLTEINFIDGQALTPSDFGLTNPQTGQWIPKKYTGTYGTNGFYLNFKDATSTTTLGYDYSGNANNWTTNNFSVTAGVGNDSLTDVPTPWVAYNTTGDVGGVVRGNYATLNPLKIYGANFTYSNGNLQVTDSSASYVASIPTLTPPNSGKWYWEVTVLSQTTASTIILGLATEANAYSTSASTMSSFGRYRSDGDITNLAGTTQTAGSSYTTNDVIGVALDVDSGTVRFYKNGVAQGATPSFSFTAGTVLVPYIVGDNTAGTKTLTVNFGQRPFAYAATGFRSLCTTNLPATTIGFGLTNQGDDYFNIALYAGNGTGTNTVTTNFGFTPDFIWIKNRTAVADHALQSSTMSWRYLSSNTTGADGSAQVGNLTDNSFLLATANSIWNASSNNYAAWCWKAGGTGVSNTAGTVTSTVSANTTARFSVVTYTGTGVAATVGHGLGVAPSMIIVKDRDDAGTNWCVYHVSLGNGNRVLLNLTNASAATGNWNSTSPTSSVFSIGVSSEVSANNKQHVAYCFAAVPGYSAFGSYTGNGSADGPFVYLGFRPRFIMIKDTTVAFNWLMVDTARDTYNGVQYVLIPNLSNAESSGTVIMDILSNGFKYRFAGGAGNTTNDTLIYAAFAESPFQFANAR